MEHFIQDHAELPNCGGAGPVATPKIILWRYMLRRSYSRAQPGERFLPPVDEQTVKVKLKFLPWKTRYTDRLVKKQPTPKSMTQIRGSTEFVLIRIFSSFKSR